MTRMKPFRPGSKEVGWKYLLLSVHWVPFIRQPLGFGIWININGSDIPGFWYTLVLALFNFTFKIDLFPPSKHPSVRIP